MAKGFTRSQPTKSTVLLASAGWLRTELDDRYGDMQIAPTQLRDNEPCPEDHTLLIAHAMWALKDGVEMAIRKHDLDLAREHLNRARMIMWQDGIGSWEYLTSPSKPN